MWDSGSSLSFVAFKLAKQLNLKGERVNLEIESLGGEVKSIDSHWYTLMLKDEKRIKIPIKAVGIDIISSSSNRIEDIEVKRLFPWIESKRVRCSTGSQIKILIGFQYTAYHPTRVDNSGHLLLLENRFGFTVAGKYIGIDSPTVKLVKHAMVLHSVPHINTFNLIENLGVSCQPECGGCRCGKCHIGWKEMSIKDEREYKLIESKITYQPDRSRWIASYPYIKDPLYLPDNRDTIYNILKSTERRLMRNEEHAKVYAGQMQDMIDRKVARKVEDEELRKYEGAKYYIAHHAIFKPESKSTPCRMVFSSSLQSMGHSLNDYLAKGPTLLKHSLSILLRFRQYKVGFIGDISKMYHSIDIPYEYQMTHLYLWRKLETFRPPDTFAITVLNMGDKPSAAIAQVALKKMAEMASKEQVTWTI